VQSQATVFSPKTLAKAWDCSDRHIRNLISRGELRAFRLGSLIRIPADAVEDFLIANNTLIDQPPGASIKQQPTTTKTRGRVG
jgi:excisionase family DNA binding protein